jgi:hypothetical protein
MAITYVNRKGNTFYLHQGVTKKGNPKYYFSQKNDGELVETIPSGFEIYENPSAQVFLRRIRPKIITDAEVEIVRSGIDKYSQTKYYQIDVKKNVIIVYLADQDVELLSEMLEFAPGARGMSVGDIANKFTTYSPMMQFVLVDAKRRQFVVERYCFLGSTDDWISIGGTDDLSKLVKEYIKHLGQDSYYELY